MLLLLLSFKQISLANYLKSNNSNSMLKFIHELNELIQISLKLETVASILDLLNKFYTYIN